MPVNREDVYLRQKAAGRLDPAGDFPSVVLLDTVSYCNFRCSMCVHSAMKRTRGIMPWGLFEKIVAEIATTRPQTRVWMVFFGDPFVIKRRKPTIFDMIRHAKDKGLTDVVTNTNAGLLDRAAAEAVIRAGLDAIYIGIDAATPGTYAKLRVGGRFEQTKSNVLGLLGAKKALGSVKPAVFVQFVEMEVNAHEKEDFIRFWSGHDVTVKIRPKVSWGGKIGAANLVLGDTERWPCHWAMHTMSITDRGLVVTCAVDLDAEVVAGDVTRQSIKDIWNGRLRELRELHMTGRYAELPPFCAACRDWQSARSDYVRVSQ